MSINIIYKKYECNEEKKKAFVFKSTSFAFQNNECHLIYLLVHFVRLVLKYFLFQNLYANKARITKIVQIAQ